MRIARLFGYNAGIVVPSARRRSAARAALIAGCVLPALVAAACLIPIDGFTLPVWWRESRSGYLFWRGDGRAREVALTFDDGPDPRYTPRVLAILKRFGVPATFFEIGKMVRAHPDLTRDVVAAGCVVGNHTETHPYLERKSDDGVRREIDAAADALEQADGIRTALFRPPRGHWNPTIFRAVRRDHDRIILWTVAVEHSDAHTPAQMAARALSMARPGAIFLLHDGGPPRERTVQALPLLIDGLQRRHYRFVTIPDLLHVPGMTLDDRSAGHADPAASRGSMPPGGAGASSQPGCVPALAALRAGAQR